MMHENIQPHRRVYRILKFRSHTLELESTKSDQVVIVLHQGTDWFSWWVMDVMIR